MKNLFSFDRTGKDTAVFVDDNPFVTARLSDGLQARMEAMDARLDAILNGPAPDTQSPQGTDRAGHKRSFVARHWPVWVSLLMVTAAFFLIRLAFRDESSAVWIMVAGIALLVCAWVLISKETRQLRKGITDTSSPDLTSYSQDMDRLAGEARRELHIPGNAAELEVLPFLYTRKKGAIKRYTPAHTYHNLLLYAWREGDSLCLSEGHAVLTIPKTAIVGYRGCDERYTVDMWLKKEKCNEGRYKQYHIRQTGLLSCRVKGYNRIVIRTDGGGDTPETYREDYEMLIPCYDWPEMEKLLHINQID